MGSLHVGTCWSEKNFVACVSFLCYVYWVYELLFISLRQSGDIFVRGLNCFVYNFRFEIE